MWKAILWLEAAFAWKYDMPSSMLHCNEDCGCGCPQSHGCQNNTSVRVKTSKKAKDPLVQTLEVSETIKDDGEEAANETEERRQEAEGEMINEMENVADAVEDSVEFAAAQDKAEQIEAEEDTADAEESVIENVEAEDEAQIMHEVMDELKLKNATPSPVIMPSIEETIKEADDSISGANDFSEQMQVEHETENMEELNDSLALDEARTAEVRVSGANEQMQAEHETENMEARTAEVRESELLNDDSLQVEVEEATPTEAITSELINKNIEKESSTPPPFLYLPEDDCVDFSNLTSVNQRLRRKLHTVSVL